MNDVPNPGLLREAIHAVKAEERQVIAKLLSEPQMERLEMLERQFLVRNQGLQALLMKDFQSSLQLSDRQRQDLVQEVRDAEETLAKELEKLRKELHIKIRMRILDEKQDETLKRLLGRPLDLGD